MASANVTGVGGGMLLKAKQQVRDLEVSSKDALDVVQLTKSPHEFDVLWVLRNSKPDAKYENIIHAVDWLTRLSSVAPHGLQIFLEDEAGTDFEAPTSAIKSNLDVSVAEVSSSNLEGMGDKLSDVFDMSNALGFPFVRCHGLILPNFEEIVERVSHFCDLFQGSCLDKFFPERAPYESGCLCQLVSAEVLVPLHCC